MHRHRSKIFYKLNLPICVYIQPQNRSGLFLVLGPQYFRGPWRWRKSSNGNGRAIKVLFLIGFLVLSANNACWVPLPVLVIVPVLILVPVLVIVPESTFWVKQWDEQSCLCSSASNNNTLIRCVSKQSNKNLRLNQKQFNQRKKCHSFSTQCTMDFSLTSAGMKSDTLYSFRACWHLPPGILRHLR